MDRVNEKSSISYTVSLLEDDNTAAVPSTVEWRLRCVETDTILQAWTTLTPTTVTGDDGNPARVTVSIAVAGTLNAMQLANSKSERKALIVCADRDLSTEWSKEIEYTVVRLKARTD